MPPKKSNPQPPVVAVIPPPKMTVEIEKPKPKRKGRLPTPNLPVEKKPDVVVNPEDPNDRRKAFTRKRNNEFYERHKEDHEFNIKLALRRFAKDPETFRKTLDKTERLLKIYREIEPQIIPPPSAVEVDPEPPVSPVDVEKLMAILRPRKAAADAKRREKKNAAK